MVTKEEYDAMIKRNKEYNLAKNKGKCPRCGTLCIKEKMVAVSTGSYCNAFCAYNSLFYRKKDLEQEMLQFVLRRAPTNGK